MLYFDGLGGLIMLGLWIFCFIDVLLTPDGACRNLPKLGWVFLVLLIPVVGPIAWLVAGRPWNRAELNSPQSPRRPLSRYAPVERAGRPSNPDDDEEFLAGLRKRAEEQRRRAREQQDRDLHDGEPG
jgi:hypothetical protein